MATSAEERALGETGFQVERLMLEPAVLPPLPRNLNIYFYVHKDLARTYRDAQETIFSLLAKVVYLARRPDWRGPPSEGADDEATLHTIEAYGGPIEPPYDGQRHLHELHIRLYYCFEQDDYGYWMIGGSVHLEPDNSHPDHTNDDPPYFGSCPLCGCVDVPSADRQRYHRDCRDVLGIECLLHGTSHGRRLHCEQGMLRGIDNVPAGAGRRVITRTTTPGALSVNIDAGCLASVIVLPTQADRSALTR